MPLRPFPAQLRIGTDIVSQTRILRAIKKNPTGKVEAAKTRLHRFLRKILTYREQQHFWIKFAKYNVEQDHRERGVVGYLAGRWAAKEAIIKAAAPRKLTFMDIEILSPKDSMKPMGAILDHPSSPYAPETTVATADPFDFTHTNGQIVELSISHDDDYATAVCLAPETPLPGDVGGEAAAREP